MPTVFKKDSYIFETGEELVGVYHLLDGNLGLLYRFESEEREYEILFSYIRSNTFFGIENFFDSLFASYSVKALEESTINKNPLKDKEALHQLIKEKPDYGIQILRSLLKTITETTNFVIQYDKLRENIMKLEAVSKGALGYLNTNYQISPDNQEIQQESKKVHAFFQKHQVPIYPLSTKIFSLPFQDLFEELEETRVVDMMDKKEINFLTKLYMLPSNIQTALYRKEPFFILYFLEKASVHFRNLLQLIEKSFKKILEKYNRLLGSGGTVSCLLKVQPALVNNQDLQRFIRTVVNTILINTLKLSRILEDKAPAYYKNLADSIERLKKLNMTVIKEGKVEVEETYTIPEELKNSTKQILQFAELDEEIHRAFVDNYNKFKLMKDRLSGDDSIRRFRKSITESYWEIYEKCFIRYYESGKLPKPVELMFRYGFFDEELVHPKTLVILTNLKHPPINPELPIYDTFEWLNAVAKGEIEPSMTSMGERYEKHLKEEAKRRSRKTIVTPEEIDSLQYRIAFEIRNMIKDCTRVCSGEIFNFSPILMEEAFAGDSYRYLTQKQRLREEFFKIRSIDFSAFYREVRFREPNEGIEEFIKTEILPNIILLPIWGKKPMVWQVKEKPKESRGRIFFPHFILDKPEKLMIETFGIYRWEIVKEILGPLWNDITQMSITAEYTDYIQSYKKSKDLSLEQKEKITQEFRKFRTDRERFVNDYITWIEFESQGRPLLNKIVRGIFYRQIPFPKEIRDKIKDMPAFAEIHNRFINLRRKDIKNLKNKYQKYTKNEKSLPRELEEYIQFHLR